MALSLKNSFQELRQQQIMLQLVLISKSVGTQLNTMWVYYSPLWSIYFICCLACLRWFLKILPNCLVFMSENFPVTKTKSWNDEHCWCYLALDNFPIYFWFPFWKIFQILMHLFPLFWCILEDKIHSNQTLLGSTRFAGTS